MDPFSITFGFIGAFLVYNSSYQVPPAIVAAYDDNYYKIEVPHEEGISKVTFYLNLNTPLQTIDQAGFTANKERSEKWTGEWSQVLSWPDPIKKGDVLNYIISVKKDGVVYTSEPGSFEVKAILPSSSRVVPTYVENK